MESINNFQLKKIEILAYPDELEKTLGVSEIINTLEKNFNSFLQEEESTKETENIKDPELKILRLIKLYIGKDRENIKNITKGSSLYGFDCLTLAILICLLANRKGYKVKIGRPDKISRYFLR